MGRPDDLETDRLLLRSWRASDREPFAVINADPLVMEHFVRPLTREESDGFADRIEARMAEDGWGLWAVEVKGGAEFVGFVGLARQTFDAPFTPCVEVGWRLASEHWGRGYAPEAASAALAFGFESVGLDEIVSMTSVGNRKSRRVMEKIGMTRDPADDFEHPNIPVGHPIRTHVLYRIRSTS